MSSSIEHIEPKLGEGIYLAKDVAKILSLDYNKTYRWMVGYWSSGLDENTQYTFGEIGNRAINFLSLMEFHTFFKLREKGISSIEIRKLHKELSTLFNTHYPFSYANDLYIEARRSKKQIHYTFSDSLIKLDEKHQISFNFMTKFFDKVEFGDDNLVSRFFPLADSRNVVVDPKHQFGQPVVSGTNIKTQTIFGLYRGGEALEDISKLYDIPLDKVQDAVAFQKAA